MMKDYTLEQIEAAQDQLCQNAPKVSSLRPILGQVGGIYFFVVETFVSFLSPFFFGVAPGTIKSRFCNSLSAAPRFVSFIREPSVAPPRCTPHDVPPWSFQRGSKALSALLAGLVTKGYRVGDSVHFTVESIATNFHYGAALATLGL